MSLLPKPYIAKSVFVDAPTQTPGTFSNGVSFEGIVNEIVPIINKTVILTADEVKALNTSPYVLVQGMNNVSIEPLSISWKITYGSIAYTVTSITSIDVTYDSIVYFTDASLLPLTATTTEYYLFPKAAITDAQTFRPDKDLLLTTVGANPTLGNSTVTIEILYKLHKWTV